MDAGTQSRADRPKEPVDEDSPDLSICAGGPGTSVLLESGNTDGWIASDLIVDVTR
jgi:hypothetical protein